MKIDKWNLIEPWGADGEKHLDGIRVSHDADRLNGMKVITTPIVGRRGQAIVTRSGSVYELGEPNAVEKARMVRLCKQDATAELLRGLDPK